MQHPGSSLRNSAIPSERKASGRSLSRIPYAKAISKSPSSVRKRLFSRRKNSSGGFVSCTLDAEGGKKGRPTIEKRIAAFGVEPHKIRKGCIFSSLFFPGNQLKNGIFRDQGQGVVMTIFPAVHTLGKFLRITSVNHDRCCSPKTVVFGHSRWCTRNKWLRRTTNPVHNWLGFGTPLITQQSRHSLRRKK